MKGHPNINIEQRKEKEMKRFENMKFEDIVINTYLDAKILSVYIRDEYFKDHKDEARKMILDFMRSNLGEPKMQEPYEQDNFQIFDFLKDGGFSSEPYITTSTFIFEDGPDCYVWEVTKEYDSIKEYFAGDFYKWLMASAEE